MQAVTQAAAEVNGEAIQEAQAARRAWEEDVQAQLEALEAAKTKEREKNQAYECALMPITGSSAM